MKTIQKRKKGKKKIKHLVGIAILMLPLCNYAQVTPLIKQVARQIEEGNNATEKNLNLLIQSKDSIKAFLFMGFYKMKKGDLDGAKRWFQKTYQADSSNYQGIFYGGLADFIKNDFKNSETSFKNIKEAFKSKSPKYVHYYLGISYFKNRKNQLAIEELLHFLNFNPKHHTASLTLAMSYHNDAQLQEAIKWYSIALKNKQDSSIYHYRAKAYFDLKEYKMSIKDYSTYLDFEPNNMDAVYQRGIAHFSLANWSNAISDFTTVLQKHPNVFYVWSNRGLAYHNLKEYPNAIKDYDQALKISPNNGEVLYKRGITHDLLGKYDLAINDFEKAKKSGYLKSDCEMQIGASAARSGNKEKACEYWKIASENGNANAQELHRLNCN